MNIDSRAGSVEKIVPPSPLPHVSRRALKRVKNPLPAPTKCHYCECSVELVSNSEIYNGRSYGDWPYAYLCTCCRAYVGLHPDTDIPLGTLANDRLRKDRNLSKDEFHKLKDRKGLSRSLAYQWLAGRMGIDVDVCHFGWFDHEQCAQALRICLDDKVSGGTMASAFAKARRAQ